MPSTKPMGKPKKPLVKGSIVSVPSGMKFAKTVEDGHKFERKPSADRLLSIKMLNSKPKLVKTYSSNSKKKNDMYSWSE